MHFRIGRLTVGALAAVTVALISAGTLLGGGSSAEAAGPCDAQLTALKQRAMSGRSIDKVQAKAVYACMASQSRPAGQRTTGARATAETPTVIATFGANFWLTATCLQYYSDGTVKASATAFDWSQWKYPPYTQSASGTYYGVPTVLSVAELKDTPGASGYAVTVGNTAVYLTPSGAFLRLRAVASCGALIGA